MRGAVMSYSGRTDSAVYQNRIHKIHTIENALKSNPAFHDHEIVTRNVPFLYSRQADIVIKTGDVIVMGRERLLIESLNFKKQEFSGTLLLSETERENRNRYMPAGTKRSESETVKVSTLNMDKIVRYLPGADEDQKKMLNVIAGEEFYQFPDESLKADMYFTHLQASVRGYYEPYMFCSGEDGGLAVKHLTYHREIKENIIFNPFTPEGRGAIISARDKGVDSSALTADDLAAVEKLFPVLLVPGGMKEKERDGKPEIEDQEAGEPGPFDISTYERRLADVFKSALEAGALARQWEGGELAEPYNPATGEVYKGINGIACILHQAAGKSADPRYLAATDINKSGMTVQPDARPLYLPYTNTEDKTAWRLLYNGADINGMPPFQQRTAQETGSGYLQPRSGGNRERRAADTLAAFMTAAKTGKGFMPSTSGGTVTADFIDGLTGRRGGLLKFFDSVNSRTAALMDRERECVRGNEAAVIGY
jgi:hypothetical protein